MKVFFFFSPSVWLLLRVISQSRFHTAVNYMHEIYDTPNLQYFITCASTIPPSHGGAASSTSFHSTPPPRQFVFHVGKRIRNGSCCISRRSVGVLGVCRPRGSSATYGEGNGSAQESLGGRDRSLPGACGRDCHHLKSNLFVEQKENTRVCANIFLDTCRVNALTSPRL